MEDVKDMVSEAETTGMLSAERTCLREANPVAAKVSTSA